MNFNNLNADNAKTHAQHYWKFLDDLAKDPEAYQKFIDQQKEELQRETEMMEERKKFMPKPSFVVFTKATAHKPSTFEGKSSLIIFVNMCHSEKVPVCQLQNGKPAPMNTPVGQVVIPLSVGKLKDEKHDDEDVKTSDCVFHPSTILRAEQDTGFKMYLIELAFQHIEEDFKIRLHRGWKLATDIRYKGGSPDLQMTEEALKEQAELGKRAKKRGEKGVKGATEEPLKEIKLPFQATAKELGTISELKLSKDQGKKTSKPLILDVIEDEPNPAAIPKYRLAESDDSLVLTVHLPDLEDSAALSVDLSSTKLLLSSPEYHLAVDFPFKIDDDNAQAKFSKKKMKLTIKATAAP